MVYAPNKASKYVRHKRRGPQGKNGQTHYQYPLPITDRSSKQKISEDMVKQNSTIHQPDLIDLHKLLHQNSRTHILLRLNVEYPPREIT